MIFENGVQPAKNRAELSRAGATLNAPELTAFKTTSMGLVDAIPVTRHKRKYKARARACAVCGTAFTPRKRTGRFCSSTCRSRNHRSKLATRHHPNEHQNTTKALPAVVCHCVYCHQPFWATEGRMRLYCKPRCKTMASRAKKTAAVAVLADTFGLNYDSAFSLVERKGMQAIGKRLITLGMHYDSSTRCYVMQ